MERHPQEVRLNTASRMLEILWHDGKQSRYPFFMLRNNCSCSKCKSAARHAGQRPNACSEGVSVTNVLPVGNYALQLVFDDGHERGIYPYTYLLELETTSAANEY